MSDSTFAERDTSGTGAKSTSEPRFLRPAASVILFVLALASITLRFHRLDELPPGLFYDEGANGLDALQVLSGKHSIYFPENSGREPLGIYLMALSVSILGRTELAIRVPTALASVCTVFAVFWLGRLLFGRDGDSGRATPWRGLLVGGVGASLLAVSIAQTVIGRTSFRVNFLPLLLTLCLALLWEGWRRRNTQQVALAGACAGLLAYTYIAARLTPILFLSFGLSFLIPWGRSELEGATKKIGFPALRLSSLSSRLWAELPLASVFVGVASVLAAPILVYFVLHPNHFFLRSSQVSVFQPGSGLMGFLWALVVNVWEHLLAFGIRGDPNWRHNYSGQPLLNMWQAIFFWVGVGTAVWRWKQPPFRLLLLWLALLLLPAFLSRDNNVPHFLRMLGATPAIFLLTGVGAWETIRFLRDRFHWWKVKWVPDLSVEGTKAVTIVVAVIGLVLIQGGNTYRAYFQDWAASPAVGSAYDKIWTDMALALNEHPSTRATVNLIVPNSDFIWRHPANLHHSFEYIYSGAAVTRFIHSTKTHELTQEIFSTLADLEEVSKVNLVDWNNSLVGGTANPDRHFDYILKEFGRYVGSESHDGFQIHSYVDVDLNRRWTLYENLEPLTVHYDGGISIYGFALGQGKEQLSSKQRFDLHGDRSWWVVLQWKTDPGLAADYSISLRLNDAEGSLVYHQDAFLENFVPFPTSKWAAEELVDTLHLLEFPPELPPGEYELQMVVYDFETLQPTVELGVWEAEKTLAKLRVGEFE